MTPLRKQLETFLENEVSLNPSVLSAVHEMIPENTHHQLQIKAIFRVDAFLYKLKKRENMNQQASSDFKSEACSSQSQSQNLCTSEFYAWPMETEEQRQQRHDEYVPSTISQYILYEANGSPRYAMSGVSYP